MRLGSARALLLKRWRTSLAVKFVVLIAGLTAVTLGATAWYSYVSYRDSQISHLQSKAELLARFVASISPDRIFSYDFLTLHSYVRELSNHRDLVYALILDANGNPMTSHLDQDNPLVQKTINEIGSKLPAKVAARIDTLPWIHSVTAPIYFNNRQIGTVKIGATRQHIETELQHILVFNILGSIVIIIGLSFGIYLIYRLNVLRPTKELMEGARRVAHGNLHEPIPLTSTDELGLLAGSFNEMMSVLDRSNEERSAALTNLRDLNRTLEIRVEERTRAIESVNRELERLALYDALTGLPNRTLFHERLEHTLQAAQRSNGHFVVLLMDLDRFKEVNDTFGHHTGDLLLQRVSMRLGGVLRDTDTIARLGGDEFAILLPNTDREGSLLVINKIFAALDKPEELEGLSLMILASLGIAVYPGHGQDSSTLLRHADIAMYEAKQAKTGYCIYHRDIDTHSPRRLALMNDLRIAFKNGQMVLNYQPIVDVRSGTIRGIEALARWDHPEKGAIPPDQFIPMVEQTGLVRSFSLWVIDSALQQWVAWREARPDLVMAVNLSMHNLQDKEFPQALSDLLTKWSVTAHALLLEVTESAIMSEPGQVLEVLAKIRDLGVDIAIDDFGTGYSSLSHLKRLPVHELKIDREFVKDMCRDKDDAVIVRSTIDLAHNLGLKVVAEGVEDAETLQMLAELKCDYAQGFYFCRPLAADQISLVPGSLVPARSKG